MATILQLGADLAVPLELGTLVSDLRHRALAHYGDVDGELLGARLVAERTGLTAGPPIPAANRQHDSRSVNPPGS